MRQAKINGHKGYNVFVRLYFNDYVDGRIIFYYMFVKHLFYVVFFIII